MNTPPLKLTTEESRFLTAVRTLSSATALPVVMSAGELAKLIGVVYHDTQASAQLQTAYPGLWERIQPPASYYDLPDGWFTQPIVLGEGEHVVLMRLAASHIPDFATYLKCLAELHKRRRKYAMILSAQPMPTMVQVSPRALIEYGHLAPQALASWLTWRKFFYDLDNRAAQETGYLFEPILAAAIGGQPMSAAKKMVRRTGDDSKGRQVDCWKIMPDGQALAYEFKLRVTIAASGQGRFSEELQFAEDCRNSGAIPILVVLDPTPNPRLAGLRAEFLAKGGQAYVGDEAWRHLEQEAGEVMARFIENYVRVPVAQISAFETSAGDDPSRRQMRLLDLSTRLVGNRLDLVIGPHIHQIHRHEDAALADDASPSDQDVESP
jgi:hypothetical protein